LLKALRDYSSHRRKFVMFEYVLIKNLNASLADAKRLVSLLKGISCKVNLIPFNFYSSSAMSPSEQATIDSFHSYMVDRGVTTLTRKSKGSDILAACGQLKSSYENGATQAF
ncbi:MAG: 23S rRNA (adenine(2503)-C(2))-methyltransferase RlmN, partial [Nitrospinota bacterium]